MSLERRRQLVDLASRYRVPILEDDPYGELRYRGERVPPLAALDNDGLVIYISTFSKTLSPGMRIGWITASEEFIRQLIIAKQATDLHTSTIHQRAVARMLERFEYDEHISQLNKVYGERSAAMARSLERHFPSGSRWTSPEGGLFLWVELPKRVDARELLNEALCEKVAFVPGAPFFAANPKHNFMRLNFSNSTPQRIEAGIRCIAGVLNRRSA
jgi:2-aminoadipate transaminase